jgi:hypothetical protein
MLRATLQFYRNRSQDSALFIPHEIIFSPHPFKILHGVSSASVPALPPLGRASSDDSANDAAAILLHRR